MKIETGTKKQPRETTFRNTTTMKSLSNGNRKVSPLNEEETLLHWSEYEGKDKSWKTRIYESQYA